MRTRTDGQRAPLFAGARVTLCLAQQRKPFFFFAAPSRAAGSTQTKQAPCRAQVREIPTLTARVPSRKCSPHRRLQRGTPGDSNAFWHLAIKIEQRIPKFRFGVL